MKINYGARANRLLCTPECTEDEMLLHKCINVSKSKKSEVYSVEDCLPNLMVLGEPISMIKPVCFHSVDATTVDIVMSRLKDYQKKDVQAMLQLKDVLNANPMGYGKTVEALAYAKLINARRVLIICPKSVKKQWESECLKWYRDDVIPYISPRTIKRTNDIVVITNYQQLLNENTLTAYKSVQWDLLILDEAHRIKNPKAQTTVAIKSLPAYNKVALTGTPIMNHPDDLWSICNFLDVKYSGGSYWGFVSAFCKIAHTFWGDSIEGLTENVNNQKWLTDLLKLFAVRNEEGAVGQGVQECTICLEMYPQQQKLYKQIKSLAVEELQKSDINIANGMSQFIKLQQVTSNPSLFDIDTNIKFDWIIDMLTDNENVKLLIFSKFKRTLYALGAVLSKHNIPFAQIHGDISAVDRESNKQKFITDPSTRVMLGTIAALGESVDGLQKVCNNVVFIDKSWSPAENNQAIGRVLRFGQDRQVNVYTLVCAQTIDEKVGKVNVHKIEDIKKVLDM